MSCDFVCQLNIGSNLAVIGAFIFTGITFWMTFSRRRKDEQIKTVMDISTRLHETERDFESVLDSIMSTHIPIPPAEPYLERLTNELEAAAIKHFNNWEWFALLVNHKEVREGYIKNHFKEHFISEYENILSEFPDLDEDDNAFPEIKALYKKWSKTAG